jgi:hypothetical protein
MHEAGFRNPPNVIRQITLRQKTGSNDTSELLAFRIRSRAGGIENFLGKRRADMTREPKLEDR